MKTKLKVSFYLKRNEIKKDGRCPIMGYITLGYSKACFNTRLKVMPRLWSGGRAVGRTKEALAINAQLDEYLVSVHKRYGELAERYERVTATQVKEAVQGMVSTDQTLMKIFASHNEEYRKRIGISRSHNTWKNYTQAYHKLELFLKKKYRLSDIPFQVLDMQFIERYVLFLKEELRLHPNTVPVCVNPLRRMVKIAIGKGLIDRDPFAMYKPQRAKYEPRYLSKNDFDKLLTTPLSNTSLELVRDMFVFASFTGLAYSDMFELTPRNLVHAPDGRVWLEFNRKKSGNKSNIPLMPLALDIINRYRDIPRNGKLLAMFCSSNINLYLKQLAEQCELDERNLTFHMARHTFATQHTLSRGVPIESVSHMMGHNSIRSTQGYAEVTTEKIHREMKEWEEKINASFTLANLDI